MTRRQLLFMATAGAAGAATKRQRVGVIGHTGRGNYGHGLDIVWKAFDSAEIIAVADPVPEGLAEAQQRTGAKRTYADYREMLAKEELDFVSVCPRHMDQNVELVTAVAEAGAHMYLEKAFAYDLGDADRMVAAIRKAGVKVQLAHQMRRSPHILKVLEMIGAGEIGQIQEVRVRGKEDSRAGGEDLMVLGSHVLDVMRMILGDPSWVFSHVTDDGKEMDPKRLGKAREPVGPVAGNEMAAMYAFDGGVHGYFATKANELTDPDRFGTHIYGEKGLIFLPNAGYPSGQPAILRSPRWVPDTERRWEPVAVDRPALQAPDSMLANALMVADLIEAVERDRKPACSEVDGLWTTEMMVGIYQSQVAGKPLGFPLKDRSHPLNGV